jgi:glycosyltransferase involved in cell wall biosynthesis
MVIRSVASLPTIDPALGLDLVNARTLETRDGTVAVIIPAHNEAATVGEVVADAFRALHALNAEGEVIVAASGCNDDTADVAANAGADVIEAPIGKGAAIAAGVRACRSDLICLIDADVRYFGDVPLAAILVAPIVRGLADATIADLHWRPVYPHMWFHGFFAPLTGRLFPELLPQAGTTPWSGQRAAVRALWPGKLPDGFSVDLALLLHWHAEGARIRPVLADDWTNPQRPKPDLLRQEFGMLVDYAVGRGRVGPEARPALERWFDEVYQLMAAYRPGADDPEKFERGLLEDSRRLLANYSAEGPCL